MAAAKAYKKAPILIAQEVAEALKGNGMFSMVEPCKPGFLNLKLSEAFLAKYVGGMAEDERAFPFADGSVESGRQCRPRA